MISNPTLDRAEREKCLQEYARYFYWLTLWLASVIGAFALGAAMAVSI